MSICTLDDANRCLGCGRTLAQIAGWARMSPEQQWTVIDAIRAGDPILREGTG